MGHEHRARGNKAVSTSVRRLAVRAAGLALLLVASLAAPGAVNGSGSAKPDGWIQYRPQCGCKPWVGNNIYNTTGTNQTAKATWIGSMVGFGEKFTFALKIQNDGTVSGRFKVKAPSSSWKIKYFRGSTNITSSVVAGTYQTSSLPPGARIEITVQVDLDTMDADPVRLVTITSSSNSTKKDAVRLMLKRV